MNTPQFNWYRTRLADWYLARTGYKSQQIRDMPVNSRPDNLYEPVPGEAATHGMFDSSARARSHQLWATTHRRFSPPPWAPWPRLG